MALTYHQMTGVLHRMSQILIYISIYGKVKEKLTPRYHSCQKDSYELITIFPKNNDRMYRYQFLIAEAWLIGLNGFS